MPFVIGVLANTPWMPKVRLLQYMLHISKCRLISPQKFERVYCFWLNSNPTISCCQNNVNIRVTEKIKTNKKKAITENTNYMITQFLKIKKRLVFYLAGSWRVFDWFAWGKSSLTSCYLSDYYQERNNTRLHRQGHITTLCYGPHFWSSFPKTT